MEFLSGQLNYKIDAYTTWRQELPPIQQASGTPIDVSSWVWLCKIRQTKASPSSLATVTIDPTDPTNGLITMVLTAAQTGALWKAAAELYNSSPSGGDLFLYFDVVGTAASGSGDTTKVFSGTIQLVATASH